MSLPGTIQYHLYTERDKFVQTDIIKKKNNNVCTN